MKLFEVDGDRTCVHAAMNILRRINVQVCFMRDFRYEGLAF